MSEYAVMMCAFLAIATEGMADIVKSFLQEDAKGAIIYFSFGCGFIYIAYRLWGMF